MAKLNNDKVLLTELAELLTQGCRVHRVTRLNMILTCGRVAVDRKHFIMEGMESMIGNRLDWRIITVGYEPFEHSSSVFSRLLASLFGTIPVCWIKISF